MAITKRIFPYTDKCYSIGTVYVNWPGVCKHFGWDPAKLCGPVIMAMSDDDAKREANCCWGHPQGHASHKAPQVDGKPFRLTDHKAKLTEKGLTVVRDELKAAAKAGKPPSGQPTKVGATLVYPARHFG